ncbi:hypothetical protein BC629DRAFT_1285243, partial [Irpex lacteus]
LFLYESIITLSQEIEVIWRRKWTVMTWLYAFTRYTLVVDTVFLFIPTGNIEVLSLATRIAVIMSDALVLAVTWLKTARLYKEARRLGVEAPLATMLFRDGKAH